MATTNDWAHTWLRIREWARIWNDMRKYSSQLGTFQWSLDQGILETDKCVFDADVDQGQEIAILAQRALVAGILSGGRSLLDPLILQLSRAMGYPQSNPDAVFPILYRYMALNQGTFKSSPRVTLRNFTRGSWTAGGSNQGNGTVLRMLVDRYDLPLEADAPDVWNFVCSLDANSGTNPGQEQFTVQGLPYRDNLLRYATGSSIGVGNQIPAPNLIGVTGDSTRNFLVNPSMSDSQGTGATFALTGWTVAAGAASTCSIDTTQYYRRSNIEQTPGSLKTTATVSFIQQIPASQFQAALAYMMQGACNFSAGGATGSVRMRLGTTATYLVDVTVSSGVAGWNVIRPTIDKKLYFANFAGAGDIYLRFDITVSSGTYILFDDICLNPWQNVAGKLLWAIGGATNWVVGDSATLTDSVTTSSNVPTTGLVQTMFAEVYGRSLPAYIGATRPTSPTLASASGGTTARGAYGVVITFYDGTTGLESLPSNEVRALLDATNNQIAANPVATGPGGTTARYFYVTQLGDYNDIQASTRWSSPASQGSAYYYAGQLADNVATSLTFDPALADLTKPLAYCGDI